MRRFWFGGIAKAFGVHCVGLGAVAVLSLISILGTAASGDAQTSADDYHLDAMDRLRLKVFEWRPSRDEVYEWKALNDEYIVGANGRISLPIIGDVAAAGLSTNELSRVIGEKMKSQIGLVEVPRISVEVIKFRPFYIVGKVQNPGEFAYRPTLTVLQAVSIAGGIYRSDRLGSVRLDREAITGKGDLDLLELDRSSLLAKKARVEADIHNYVQIKFPAELDVRRPNIAKLLQQEIGIRDSLQTAFKVQLDTLTQLKTDLQAEAESIKKQLVTHDAEVALAQEELRTVQSLARQKLAVESRRIQVQRGVYDLDQDHMRLEQSLMRTAQEIGKTDLSISEVRTKRAKDLAEELRDTQSKLDDADRKYETTKQLLIDTAAADGGSLDDPSTGKSPLNYKIVRNVAGQSVEISADETTPVEPGDTIKVQSTQTLPPLARSMDQSGAGEKSQIPEPGAYPQLPRQARQSEMPGI